MESTSFNAVSFKVPVTAAGAKLGVDKIRHALLRQLQTRGPLGTFVFARSVSRSINGLSLLCLQSIFDGQRLSIPHADVALLFSELDLKSKRIIPCTLLLEFLKINLGEEVYKGVDKLFHDNLGRMQRFPAYKLISLFNAKNHPDVKNGRCSEEVAFTELLATMDFGNLDVTLLTLRGYMELLGSSYVDKNYFHEILANCWGLDISTMNKTTFCDDGYGQISQCGNEASPFPAYAVAAAEPENAANSRLTQFEANEPPPALNWNLTRNFAPNATFQRPSFSLCQLRCDLLRIAPTEVSLSELKTVWPKYFGHERGLNIVECEVMSKSGYINIDNLMALLWQRALNPKREKIVEMAFKKLDPSDSGEISFQTLKKINHPLNYENSSLSNQQHCGRNIMDFYPTGLTWNEFKNFYTDLGSEIEEDSFFVLQVWQEWDLSSKK